MLHGSRALCCLVLIAGATTTMAKAPMSDDIEYSVVSKREAGGFVTHVLSLPGGELAIVVAADRRAVALTYTAHAGDVESLLLGIGDETPAPATKTDDEWTAVCVYCNANTGAGLYAIYLNGTLFGMLTVSANGQFTFERTQH